jgi:HlyD family secretion protein
MLIIGLFFYSTRTKPVQVRIAEVAIGSIEETVANTRAGTVKACHRALITPAIGGQIAKLPVREGDYVEQGTLLLELWNKDLKAQLELARSQAKAARASAESVCVRADIAARNASRNLALSKTKVISEERVDQIVGDAKAQKADCESAQSSARVSAAQINLAKAHLERTLLIAPFAGIIAEVTGELGEYVTPSPPGIATLPVIDMVGKNCFYVSAPIDEVDAPLIKPGMQARISLDAFKQRRFPGTVRRIANYVLDREKQARTVEIEVDFSQPEVMQELLPGYSADTEVIINTRAKALRVPTEAVINKQQVFVFHVDEKLLELREVKIGLSNWDHTEIVEGLDAGESVVLTVERKGVVDDAFAIAEIE